MTSSNPPQMPRLTKGRQRIEMKKITNKQSLLVSFTKRYQGLFKKASELGTLCGVDIGIIVFTPSHKVSSFAHPSIQVIVDRYLSQNPPESSSTSQIVQHYRNKIIQELNTLLTYLLGQIEAAKKTGEELNQLREARNKEISLYDAEELDKLKVAMLELKMDVENQTDKLKVEVADPSTSLGGAGPMM